MRLLPDNTTRAAAFNTVAELVDAGYAGYDCYDHDLFIVDVPRGDLHDNAEVALDQLGAAFLRNGAHGRYSNVIQARLPRWVWQQMGDLPEIVTPLASRGVGFQLADAARIVSVTDYSLHRMIDEVQR